MYALSCYDGCASLCTGLHLPQVCRSGDDARRPRSRVQTSRFHKKNPCTGHVLLRATSLCRTIPVAAASLGGQNSCLGECRGTGSISVRATPVVRTASRCGQGLRTMTVCKLQDSPSLDFAGCGASLKGVQDETNEATTPSRPHHHIGRHDYRRRVFFWSAHIQGLA
jgi:hypothetical protein